MMKNHRPKYFAGLDFEILLIYTLNLYNIIYVFNFYINDNLYIENVSIKYLALKKALIVS